MQLQLYSHQFLPVLNEEEETTENIASILIMIYFQPKIMITKAKRGPKVIKVFSLVRLKFKVKEIALSCYLFIFVTFGQNGKLKIGKWALRA